MTRPLSHSIGIVALLGLPGALARAQSPAADNLSPPPCSSLEVRAVNRQPAPGGGTLDLPAGMVACIGAGGRMAFMSQVDDAPRNQGIFVADDTGLHPIAMGCGGPGGSGQPGTCGDPSPIGGTFAGFFGDPVLMPAINSGGDVLFLADVTGGSAKRGLFLHVAASGALVKVAAPGDPAPGGGAFTKVGVGSLGDGGDVAFLASTSAGLTSDVYRWKAGVTSKVVAVGDPAPGGGTIDIVGDQSQVFADGTKIPVGLAPAVNASGQVAVRVHSDTKGYELIVCTNGVSQRYVGVGNATPAGGKYASISAPCINGWGEIGFSASLTGADSDAGLFAGRPGAWRKVVVIGDTLPDGGTCDEFADLQSPTTPLDDAGNFVFWSRSLHIIPSIWIDGLFEARADGGLVEVEQAYAATPLGVTGGFLAPPSQCDGAVAVTVIPVGGQSGIPAGHLAALDAVTWQDLGHSLAGSAGLPRLCGDGALIGGEPGALHVTSAKPLAPLWLLVGTGAGAQPFKGGVLVPTSLLVVLPFATNASGTLDLAWESWPVDVPACTTLVFQAWILDPAGPSGAAASNGLLGRTE